MLLFNPLWGKPVALPPFNLGIGIFAGGQTANTNSSVVSTTDLYAFPNDTVTSGATLTAAAGAMQPFGNSTAGAYVGGNNSAGSRIATNQLYTYASNSIAPGNALTDATSNAISYGNASSGFVAGGGTNTSGSNGVATIQKFNWSTKTWASGGNLGAPRVSSGACNTATTAYITGGSISGTGVLTTQVQDLSSLAVTAGTSTSTNRGFLVAAATTTVGYFAAGLAGASTTGVVDKYTFSGNTVASGTALTHPTYNPGIAGNAAEFICSGGSPTLGTMTNISQKYTYSGDTVASGTNLSSNRGFNAGNSSLPGSF